MKMNKKGFTLIELLAVIVILAIIALIATPIILGIINDSRDSAKERSAELVISGVELAYNTAYMTSYEGGSAAGAVPSLSEVKGEFEMSNAKWTEDNKITTDDGVECSVTTTGKKLSVSCPKASTKTEMALSATE